MHVHTRRELQVHNLPDCGCGVLEDGFRGTPAVGHILIDAAHAKLFLAARCAHGDGVPEVRIDLLRLVVGQGDLVGGGRGVPTGVGQWENSVVTAFNDDGFPPVGFLNVIAIGGEPHHVGHVGVGFCVLGDFFGVDGVVADVDAHVRRANAHVRGKTLIREGGGKGGGQNHQESAQRHHSQ